MYEADLDRLEALDVSTSWTGQIAIDEGGSVSGVLNGPGGQTLTPAP